jgi:hypothetical protein
MKTAEDLVVEEFGTRYVADRFSIYRELTSEIPTLAVKSGNCLAERSEEEDIPVEQVIVLLQQARDDRKHALHRAITRQSQNGWTNPEWAWELFQQLADGIIAHLKAA